MMRLKIDLFKFHDNGDHKFYGDYWKGNPIVGGF
jgi:hypothetical protein